MNTLFMVQRKYVSAYIIRQVFCCINASMFLFNATYMSWVHVSIFLLLIKLIFMKFSSWVFSFLNHYRKADLSVCAGIIKVGTHVIWCYWSPDSSNWDSSIQSQSYRDNRGFCRKFGRVSNFGSCNNCKWCFTFWISSSSIPFISGWSCVVILPMVS